LDKKNCCDLNLGESLGIFTFFLFSDSGLYLLNDFDFDFDLFLWRDTENHQLFHELALDMNQDRSNKREWNNCFPFLKNKIKTKQTKNKQTPPK